MSYILNDPFKSIVEAKKKSLAAHNSNIWWSFTTKLEPISRKMPETKPRHLAGKSARCAPPEKPFDLFFEFPPPRFLVFEKDVFWASKFTEVWVKMMRRTSATQKVIR